MHLNKQNKERKEEITMRKKRKNERKEQDQMVKNGRQNKYDNK